MTRLAVSARIKQHLGMEGKKRDHTVFLSLPDLPFPNKTTTTLSHYIVLFEIRKDPANPQNNMRRSRQASTRAAVEDEDDYKSSLYARRGSLMQQETQSKRNVARMRRRSSVQNDIRRQQQRIDDTEYNPGERRAECFYSLMCLFFFWRK